MLVEHIDDFGERSRPEIRETRRLQRILPSQASSRWLRCIGGSTDGEWRRPRGRFNLAIEAILGEAVMQARELGDFEARLKREGYQEVTTVEMTPGQRNPTHTHDFDAQALILDGDITISCDGKPRRYTSGDVFSLAAGTPHEEAIGGAGVRYLVGRRRSQ
jgi:mannose-6-phosphate isomerase-like protein (cupin superfamily)